LEIISGLCVLLAMIFIVVVSIMAYSLGVSIFWYVYPLILSLWPTNADGAHNALCGIGAGATFSSLAISRPKRLFVMRTLIGTVVDKPTKMILTDGQSDQVPIDGMYFYQRGEIYRFYPAGPAPVSVGISAPSPGILIQADIEGLGAMQMKARANPELLLLP
jgi:hypothetical protein